MSLALAVLAEHLTMDTPLPELLARLGAGDKANLPSMVIEVECAAIALRDLVAPRNGSEPGAVAKQKDAPVGTVLQRNRYKGTCPCGRHVPEGRGRAIKRDNGWGVLCYPCVQKGGQP